MAKKARNQKSRKGTQKKTKKSAPIKAEVAKKLKAKPQPKVASRIEAIAKAKAKNQPALGASHKKGPAPYPPKVPGRRGRRPKNLTEYTPQNNEEDSYVLESEYQSIEYDTGIQVSGRREDAGMSLDRAEDFDEELNFDW